RFCACVQSTADGRSEHRLKVVSNSALADFPAVSRPFVGRFAEMKPDQDARQRILRGRLREAAIGALHRSRVPAGTPGRKLYPAVPEAYRVAAEYLLEHLGTDPAFNRVTGGIVLVRRRRTKRRPGRVAGGIRVAVRLPSPDGGHRPPVAVMVLGGGHCDVAI